MDVKIADSIGFDTLVSAVGDNPTALLNLARTMFVPKGQIERARSLSQRAVELAPNDPEIAARAQWIEQMGIGAWYFTMVQDHDRHQLYADALRQLIPNDAVLLDIGAGTGLFAMIAAHEGAREVYACEQDKAVADAAIRVVAANELSDRVKILNKTSNDLQVGSDLPRRADVLLWDNLANNLFGAGGAPTIEDAKKRLLTPDAIIIPGRVEVMVALVAYGKSEDNMMGEVHGFDLSAFNTLRRTDFTSNLREDATVTSSAAIFDVNFVGNEAPRQERSSVLVTAQTTTTVHAIAQWLRFHLTDEIVYDTSAKSVTAFGVQMHAVEPFEVSAGQKITIAGAHDLQSTWFWIAADGSTE